MGLDRHPEQPPEGNPYTIAVEDGVAGDIVCPQCFQKWVCVDKVYHILDGWGEIFAVCLHEYQADQIVKCLNNDRT